MTDSPLFTILSSPLVDIDIDIDIVYLDTVKTSV